MKKSSNIQELLHRKSKHHGTNPMHPLLVKSFPTRWRTQSEASCRSHNYKTKQTTFLHWYIASITWIKTKAHFTLGVRANVQPKSSIPIGAKDKEISPKGFTLGVKAERENKFSTCPKLLINAELYGLVLAPRLKKNTIKFEGSICNLGANVLSMSSCQCSIM